MSGTRQKQNASGGPGDRGILMRPVPSASEKAYIDSVDGLRAISVVLVLLFHASVPHFDGGYVGVDAFFVISGYVITRNISHSIERDHFSYVTFLMRRFARLAPAMLTVVAVTILTGIYIATPRQLVELARESVSAVLAVSNIFFFFNSGYFDGDAASKPLLHTWSLGVEEQFYLVWPLFVTTLYKLGRRTFAGLGIFCVSVLSYAAAAWLARQAPDAVFYLMPFRVYQLGIGALIAVTGLSIRGHGGTAATFASFTGLIATAICCSGSTSVAISGTLSATAAALFICGAQSRAAAVLFGNRFMSSIGRRAYSIYLVHWPLIVMSRDFAAGTSVLVSAPIIVAASLLLGDLLHRFIENPIRQLANLPTPAGERRRRVLVGPLSIQATVIAAAVVIIQLGGFVISRPQDLAKMIDHTRAERGEIGQISEFGRCTLADGFNNFDPDGCLSIAADRPTIAVLGDSFGIDTIVALRDRFGSRYHFAHASLAGCAPVVPSENYRQSQHCIQFNKQRFGIVEDKGFKAVLLTSMWRGDFTKQGAETVKFLSSKGIKVYVLGVRAIFDQDVTDIVMKAGNVGDADISLRSHLLPGIKSLDEDFSRKVRDAGGTYIEVLLHQCSTTCPTTIDDALLYVDSAHFSHAGMTLLGDIIDRQVHGRFF